MAKGKRNAWAAGMLALALACASLPAGAGEPRMASINLCADQLLLALAKPEQIVSLGPFARDPVLSYQRAQALAFPANKGGAEAALAGNPSRVAVGQYDSPATRRLLAASGKPLLVLPPWAGFEAGARDIRAVAAALGRESAGEALVAAIEAARQRAAGAGGGRRVLVLGRGGYVDVSASLVHDLIRAVGLVEALPPGRDAAERAAAGRFLSLEELVALKPDVVILGEASLSGRDRKAQLFAHPAFRKAFGEGAGAPQRIVLPERLTACGGPSLVEALDTLVGALRRGTHHAP